VIANSPAAKAGLTGGTRSAVINGNSTPVGGDVVTAIDGHAVNTFEDMVSYLYENAKVGQTVTLTVMHGSQEKTVDITLGSLAASGNQ
jgi:S1-C subfamily serine protease